MHSVLFTTGALVSHLIRDYTAGLQDLDPDVCVCVIVSAHIPSHFDCCADASGASALPLSVWTPRSHLSARVLFVSTALLCLLWISVLGWCAEGWKDKVTIQTEHRFLWWCSVGEQEKAASWRETRIIEDHKHNTTQINPGQQLGQVFFFFFFKNFCFENKTNPLLCFLQIA